MTYIDLLNWLFVALSVGLGAIGWMAPRYVADTLDLATTNSTMGLSELRASAGALFVGLGVGAVILGSSEAYAMIGMAWLGASVGRITSIVMDGATQKKWVFFVIELLVGVGAIAINI